MSLSFLESKRNKLIIATCLTAAFLLYFVLKSFYFSTESTDNAYLKSDVVIIKSKVIGYIVKAIANDNQFLKAGQLIAKIDDKDYKLKVDIAEEKLKSAKARLNTILYQIKIQREELNKALALQNSVSARLERADREYTRVKGLLKDKAVSQAEFDQAKEAFINAQNEYVTSSINVKEAKHQQEIVNLQMEEAQAFLKASQAELKLALIDLENTEIRAATDGVVTKKSLQVGQLASPKISLGYLVNKKTWIEANFKESQTAKMRPGQKVLVKIDSIPGIKFNATIDSISPATGAEFSILPPENATGNFTKIVQRVPVKITFDENQDLSLLKTGLSCEVKVYL